MTWFIVQVIQSSNDMWYVWPCVFLWVDTIRVGMRVLMSVYKIYTASSNVPDLFWYVLVWGMYITTELVWLGWVLWHINHLRLFYVKSCLYIYIKYIYDLWTHFLDNILKWAWILFCMQWNGFNYCNITVTI